MKARIDELKDGTYNISLGRLTKEQVRDLLKNIEEIVLNEREELEWLEDLQRALECALPCDFFGDET